MKKEITVRQLILILSVSLITLKVLYFPSLLAKDIGRDGYLFVFFMLILDLISLGIFLFIFNKNPNLSFDEILEAMFGKILSKIIMFLLIIFFLLKAFGIFQANFTYLNENLYSSLKWYYFVVPILISVLFVVNYGENSVARLCEFFAPVVLIGFICSLFIGVFKSDYSNLLPVLENGVGKGISNIFNLSFWFGDYFIFVIFFGKIKTENKMNSKILIRMLFLVLIVVFFIATSYALFSYSSVSHTNAVSDVLQVLPSTSDTGSFDWLLILVWDIALFLSLVFGFLGALNLFSKIFFDKYSFYIIIFLLMCVLVPSIVINFDINTGIEFVTNYAKYFCVGINYGLPILMLIFSFRIKKLEAGNAKRHLEK